jgi:hypothetical protein
MPTGTDAYSNTDPNSDTNSNADANTDSDTYANVRPSPSWDSQLVAAGRQWC